MEAIEDDPNELAIDVKIFRAGLSCLGKTFNNARHAYLRLNIAEKGLSTLKGIERYKYLQYIDVSGNFLSSLKHIGEIKHLVKLNASNNRLRKMLDFQPPANLSYSRPGQSSGLVRGKHFCLEVLTGG